MQELADSEGGRHKNRAVGLLLLCRKGTSEKYDLDESKVREYFAVDSVRKGIFTMAERLYGVKFTEMPDAPKYYDEVTVYDVTDAATGEHVAVFMTDYFPAPETPGRMDERVQRLVAECRQHVFASHHL